MRKTYFAAFMLVCGLSVSAQAVKDRNVIPVAVNLNQVLRMTITNGGNIEFVFNTIEDYKNGMSSDATTSSAANPPSSNSMYKTDFSVSSSTRWALTYGTEEISFLGTDHPTAALALSNVGFKIVSTGNNTFEGAALGIGITAGASLFSIPTANASKVTALQTYPVVLITDNQTINANAGDAADNLFTLDWRCGTAEGQTSIAPMNAVKLIDQSPSPVADRYVANVLFELSSL